MWISIEISLRFVPKDIINNIPAMFQVMAWRRPGDKPLCEPMMVSLLTSLGLVDVRFEMYTSVWRRYTFGLGTFHMAQLWLAQSLCWVYRKRTPNLVIAILICLFTYNLVHYQNNPGAWIRDYISGFLRHRISHIRALSARTWMINGTPSFCKDGVAHTCIRYIGLSDIYIYILYA